MITKHHREWKFHRGWASGAGVSSLFDSTDDFFPVHSCHHPGLHSENATLLTGTWRPSPIAIDPWTGGLPTQFILDNGPKQSQPPSRQQEQKAKSSFFDEGSVTPSDHDQDEEASNSPNQQ